MSTEIREVKLVRAYDRDVGSSIFVNGEEFLHVNYDEHGSAGESLLEEVAKKLAGLADVALVEDELDDDEFRALCGIT